MIVRQTMIYIEQNLEIKKQNVLDTADSRYIVHFFKPAPLHNIISYLLNVL